MAYTYRFPRPAVTVDCLIFSRDGECIKLLLIQRDRPPFEALWALPGGFVEIDEDLKDAAYRELKEETGISGIELFQFRAFGQPDRDPRGRTISIVYYGFLEHGEHHAHAGSDARNVGWYNIDHLPSLAFDHKKIIMQFREQLSL